MTDIGFYIRQLLYIYPRVYVPGIGTFSRVRTAASFSESEKFLQPGTFFIQVTESDQPENAALISRHLSALQGLPAAEIMSSLETWASEIKKQLQDGRQVLLNNLGILSLRNGALHLQTLDENFRPFGKTRLLVEEITPEEAVQPALHELESAAVVPGSEQHHRERKWWWSAALALAALAAGGIIFFYVLAPNRSAKAPKQTESLDRPIMGTDTTAAPSHTIRETDSPAMMSESKGTGYQSDSRTTEGLGDTVLITRLSKAYPYHIIIGSLPSIDKAKIEVENYRAKGVQASILDSNVPNNRKKISYAAYRTWQEAAKDLPRVKKEVNAEAYVYPNSATPRKERKKIQ